MANGSAPWKEDFHAAFLEGLKDRLGLKLESPTAPVDGFVIDHIEESISNWLFVPQLPIGRVVSMDQRNTSSAAKPGMGMPAEVGIRLARMVPAKPFKSKAVKIARFAYSRKRIGIGGDIPDRSSLGQNP
jgi:Protein of unknown function (DUF3738)